MKPRKRTIVLSSFLALAAVAAIYFFVEAALMRQKLNELNTEYEEQVNQVQQLKGVFLIDSLLVEGNYEAALTSYEQLENQTIDSSVYSFLALRIALTQQLQQYKAASRVLDTATVEPADTVNTIPTATPEEIRQYDSLQLALQKALYQLENVERQLTSKSFGEYLTFKSRNNNEVYYVGEVKQGKANGRGVALWSTGSRYEGEWKGNLRHGEGTFYWPDGEKYVGDYVNDKREGKGTYEWPNGQKFVGEWSNDQRNGTGVFYNEDGAVMASGTWQNDELVEVEKN